MNPISLLLLSGGATFLYDKYKEKKALDNGSSPAHVGRNAVRQAVPPPLKFSPADALQFTRIVDGYRIFDKQVIDSPEIRKWLKFSSTEVIPQGGPPGCQAWMVLPFGAQPTPNTIALINEAVDGGMTVALSLSLVYIGGVVKAPIMVLVGDEGISRLCNAPMGDFALWPHSKLPAVKAAPKPEPEPDIETVEATAEVVEKDEPTKAQAPMNGTAKLVS